MKNAQAIFLIIIVAVGMIFGGLLLAPSDSSTNSNSQQIAKNDPELIENSSAPRIGSENAKAKIVVFSDYLCPYCKTAHDVLSGVIDKYKDDVSVVYRSFIIHPEAEIHSRAAEAAAKQGKFKEMSDALFEKEVEGTEYAMKSLAKDLKLNIDQFIKDLNSDEIKARVASDDQAAKALGLQGTPSLFLNNSPVENFNTIESEVSKILGK